MRDQDFFWEGAKSGQLLIQRCADCGHLRHPPGPFCPKCQSEAWTSEALSGRGTVYAFIASHHPNRPEQGSRLVALIDLVEGPRLVSNLVDIDFDDVQLGMKVSVVYRDVDGIILPQFKPVEG